MWNIQMLLPGTVERICLADKMENWAVDFEYELNANQELNIDLIKRIFIKFRPILDNREGYMFDLHVELENDWYALEVSIWKKLCKMAVLFIKVRSERVKSYIDYLEV